MTRSRQGLLAALAACLLAGTLVWSTTRGTPATPVARPAGLTSQASVLHASDELPAALHTPADGRTSAGSRAADCDSRALFETALEELAARPARERVSVVHTYPWSWMTPAWECALEHERGAAPDEQASDALAHLAGERLLDSARPFLQACLIEALARLAPQRFEVWQMLLDEHAANPANWDEPVKVLLLARMPDFQGQASEPGLPGMLRGSMRLAQDSEDCCGAERSGFGQIAAKFPTALAQLVIEQLLVKGLTREPDLDAAPEGVLESVCGGLRLLAVLVETGRVDAAQALLPALRADADRLAENERTAIAYFRLLQVCLDAGDPTALQEALRLGGNARVDARRLANLLAEHVQLADVNAWLADPRSTDQALRILIALPLESRPSPDALAELVHASRGETYQLALRAWLGPMPFEEREQRLRTEFEAADSIETRLGILDTADFYRRPTLEAALLDAILADAGADPRLRARAAELQQRFQESLPVGSRRP